MSYDEAGKNITGVAGSAVSQFHFVAHAVDGEFDHAGAGVLASGVAQADADAQGKAFPIAIMDGSVVKVKAGAAFARNANLTPNASGKAVAATTGNQINAIALEASNGADEIVAVQLMFRGVSA